MLFRSCLFIVALWLFPYNSSTLCAQSVDQGAISNVADTIKVQAWINTAQYLRKSHPDSAQILAKHALAESYKHGYFPGVRQSLLLTIEVADQQKNYLKIINTVPLLLWLCDQKKDRLMIAKAYYFLGQAHERLSGSSEAFKAFSRSVALAPDSFSLLPGIYNNMGYLLFRLFQFPKAITFFEKAIAKGRQMSQYDVLSMGYTNKAIALTELKRYNESIPYYDSAILIARSHNLYKELLGAYIFKINLYNKMGQYDQASAMAKLASRISQEPGIPFQRKYLLHMFRGNTYMGQGSYTKAEQEYLKAKKGELNFQLTDQASLIHQLSSLYAVQSRFREAYYLHLQSHQVLDSVKSLQITANVNALETQFRTAEKDREIALKNLDITRQDKELAEQRNWLLLTFSILSISISALVLAIWRYRHFRARQKQQQEISRLNGIIEGEEKERARLAQDLHDGVSSQLAAVQTFLFAGKQSADDGQRDKNINAAYTLLLDTAKGVRQIAHNLAPTQIVARGLASAIQDFCEHFFTHTAIRPSVEIYGSYANLSETLSVHIYRIVQELAQNVRKHSGASLFSLVLFKSDEIVLLTIEDNGKGMVASEMKEKSTGMGLKGIADRIGLYRGTIEFETPPQGGTVAHIRVPLPETPVEQKDRAGNPGNTR